MTIHNPHTTTPTSRRPLDHVQLFALIAAALFLSLGLLAVVVGASWLVLLPSAVAIVFATLNLRE